MAQEAVKQSDKVILTSDNPRDEEPQAIIDDMMAGLNASQKKKVLTIVDRKEAIRTACMMAQKGDVILVAGKGHETYQEVNGVKHHFDDHEVLRRHLRSEVGCQRVFAGRQPVIDYRSLRVVNPLKLPSQ